MDRIAFHGFRLTDTDAVRRGVRSGERPRKSIPLFVVSETRGHPETEARLIFRGRNVISVQFAQSQRGAVLGGKSYHCMFHVSSHDPAAQHKVGDHSPARLNLET